MKLSARQGEVFDYIKKYEARHGYAPSLEEIQAHFGFASVSTAHFHVNKIRHKGYLSKADNTPRAINLHEEIELVAVPIKGTIAAGLPIEAIEENEETIAVPKNRLPRSGDVYALRVAGDSMIKENIFDGDIVVIRDQPTAENGEKVVALIDGESATLKSLYRENTQIRLQPANPSMAPMLYDSDRVEVQGKVVAVIRSAK